MFDVLNGGEEELEGAVDRVEELGSKVGYCFEHFGEYGDVSVELFEDVAETSGRD